MQRAFESIVTLSASCQQIMIILQRSGVGGRALASGWPLRAVPTQFRDGSQHRWAIWGNIRVRRIDRARRGKPGFVPCGIDRAAQ